MSRLGDARPSSRKVKCRCEISARPARSSCERPRCSRHQRSLDAKLCSLPMSTSEVVAPAMPRGRMAHMEAPRQERPMGEGWGVLVAIVSSALGGTAAAVTRYLVVAADPITLAVLRWGIGFAVVLPVALLLRGKWPQRS